MADVASRIDVHPGGLPTGGLTGERRTHAGLGTGALRWRTLHVTARSAAPPWLRYQAGGVEFIVYPTELAGANQATAAGFSLENFDEVIAFLRSNGVAFEHVDFGDMGATVDGVITTPDGQKAAWFKDSEGNTFALSMAD